MLNCITVLDNGETVEPQEGNQLINELVGCLKGRGLTVAYSQFILDEAKSEIYRIATF